MKPFSINYINDSLTCTVYPSARFPDGMYLTYDTCPENYDTKTSKVVRVCCLNIMIILAQNSLYKRSQDFLRYNSSSVLVGPAVLFNVLSLIVLSKFQRGKSGGGQISTTFYMKCLCILDTLTIVSKFVYEVIVVRNGLREHPLVITSFLCKFLSFSEALCAISAIYILIAMSIDKLICVLAPLKVGQILTTKKARIIFSCILIVSAIISSYNLFDKRVFKLVSDMEASPSSSSSSSSSSNGHSNVTVNSTAAAAAASVYQNVIAPTWLNTSMMNNLTDNSSNHHHHNHHQQQHTVEESSSAGVAEEEEKRISYDCDSNWPKRKNDWVLINNIIRVFLPILILCVCNSWIAIALAKARRNTAALFNNSHTFKRNSANFANSSMKSMKSMKSNHTPTHKTASSLYLDVKEYNNGPDGSRIRKFKFVNNRRQSLERCSSDSENDFLSVKGHNSSNNNNNNNNGDSGKRASCSTIGTYSNIGSRPSSNLPNLHIRGQKSTHHISIMLFAVSIGFVMLNLPFAIRTLFHRQYQENYKIFDFLYHDDNLFSTDISKTEIRNAIRYEFFTTLTHLLLDLNYIANFFLYFFSGSKFRSQLFAMFKLGKHAKKENNKNFTNTHYLNRLENSQYNSSSNNNDKRLSVQHNRKLNVGGHSKQQATKNRQDKTCNRFLTLKFNLFKKNYPASETISLSDRNVFYSNLNLNKGVIVRNQLLMNKLNSSN